MKIHPQTHDPSLENPVNHPSIPKYLTRQNTDHTYHQTQAIS
jgi:hypothetical protein